MPTLLQRANPLGKSNYGAGAPAAMTPATRASNFGAGSQPARRAPGAVNPMPTAGRDLGTMTSADLERSPTGSPNTIRPALTGTRPTSGYAEYTPPATGLARAPSAVVGTPSPRPPQQTERANPLTGDNNLPPEGATTSLARVPFVQRGGGLPAGQDAAPAVKQTITEDNDIGAAMNGTLGRIGGTGAFARKFGNPTSASAYDNYVKRLFPSGS